nr:beta-alanine-activating enzyme isoform X2 [Parasteatoda tepidariorum]
MTSQIKSLFDLFENCPHLTSRVIFHDFISSYTFNHEELVSSINEVASTLFSVCGNNTAVACLIKPCLILPSIILGILKTSSTFAFLDIHKPVVMLNNLQRFVPIGVLLVENKMLEKLDGLCSCWKKTISKVIINISFTVLQSINCEKETCFQSKARDIKSPSDFSIAYIVQTSGSTGQPKIVQVPHQCILPNILDLKSQFSINTDDNILLCSPLTFDPSIIDIFLFCASGCTLTIIPDEIKSIPKKLAEVIIDNKITILQGTPSLISSLGDEFIQKSLLSRESSLKTLAFGGEICPSINKLRKWISPENKTMLFNLYGLTEVSCWATCHKINVADTFVNAAIPLGKLLSDTNLKLDNNDEGELQIGSHKRWCIVDDESFPEKDTAVFRRTGDIVIQDSFGNFYFKERKDNTIKYKGRKLSLEILHDTLDVEEGLSNYSVYFDQKHFKLLLYLVLKKSRTFSENERKTLIMKLRKNCPNAPPIELFTVPYIPLTSHGKTDYRRLLLLAKRKVREINKTQLKESCSEVISELWREFTNQPQFTEDSNFIISGGDSISALQLSSNIEWAFQINVPNLVDRILNSSFCNVVKLVQSHLHDAEKITVKEANNCDVLQKNPTLFPSKRKCIKRLNSDNQCYQVFSKQECVTRCACGCDHSNIMYNLKNIPHSSFSLIPMFKFDLKKCIDASPCIVHYLKSDELFCYIGSHAGIFSCINITKEDMEWETVLPNRIESSACLSSCGNFVFVGCYDCHLYCLDSKYGTILWKFQTGAEVKCSPIVSSENIIFVGSHDKHVYAIDINGELLWKSKVSSGSIFASPALHEEIKAVCIATLDGTISFLKMKMKYKTNGPVFSSAANASFPGIIIFGCHDGIIYCLNETSDLLWNFSCDAPIYATPFIFKWNGENFVAVASTKGSIYILKLKNGKLIMSYNCPGEIFSSPVIVNNLLLIGCRDNNVYCFKIE